MWWDQIKPQPLQETLPLAFKEWAALKQPHYPCTHTLWTQPEDNLRSLSTLSFHVRFIKIFITISAICRDEAYCQPRRKSEMFVLTGSAQQSQRSLALGYFTDRAATPTSLRSLWSSVTRKQHCRCPPASKIYHKLKYTKTFSGCLCILSFFEGAPSLA